MTFYAYGVWDTVQNSRGFASDVRDAGVWPVGSLPRTVVLRRTRDGTIACGSTYSGGYASACWQDDGLRQAEIASGKRVAERVLPRPTAVTT